MWDGFVGGRICESVQVLLVYTMVAFLRSCCYLWIRILVVGF